VIRCRQITEIITPITDYESRLGNKFMYTNL